MSAVQPIRSRGRDWRRSIAGSYLVLLLEERGSRASRSFGHAGIGRTHPCLLHAIHMVIELLHSVTRAIFNGSTKFQGTLDLYGHLVPEASTRIHNALDKAFGI